MVQSMDESLMVGFRYEYVMYGTDQKLIDCYNVLNSFSILDGVPNGIEMAFTINPSMYLSNVMEVLNNTRSIITKGKNSAIPTYTANQNKAMVEVLEVLGFYFQLFEKFSTIATVRKELNEKDATVKNTYINAIKKTLYTREHSRNSSLLCEINVKNGKMTKGFTSLDELAIHLYGKYGENWQNYIRTVSPSGSLTKHKGVKVDIASNIHGIFPTIRNITYNRTRYDCPCDGSYMYHYVSAVLQPIMREQMKVAIVNLTENIRIKCSRHKGLLT